MKLLLNAIKCLSCNSIIASSHRHDFKSCPCGKVSVDGGNEYTRRAWKTDATYEERCAYVYNGTTRPGEAAGKFLVWSPGGKTNSTTIFDHKEDAELVANDMGKKLPPSDWYVAQLSHVPIAKT